MSDETPTPPTPPVPQPPAPGAPSLQKTQSVPLKKETVRITLRAKPGEAPEGAPVPPPTAPLRPMAPPPPGGAPRPPAPPAPVGSRTIPLTSPQPPRAPGAPAPAGRPATAPLAGSPATQAMPRPTVRLQPQPAPSGPGVGSPSSAPLKTAVLDADDEEVNEGPLNILSWVALAAAVVFFLIPLFTYDGFAMGVDNAGTSSWKVPPKDLYQISGAKKSTMELKEVPGYTGLK